jgi:hypothetical protein
MKNFGYTPYGCYNAIKLYACLSITEANKLCNTYKEWLVIGKCYHNKNKYSIEGMLPHSSMTQWLAEFKLAIAKSKAHFAQQVVIQLEQQNGNTYHYMDEGDPIPRDTFADMDDDLPF